MKLSGGLNVKKPKQTELCGHPVVLSGMTTSYYLSDGTLRDAGKCGKCGTEIKESPCRKKPVK